MILVVFAVNHRPSLMNVGDKVGADSVVDSKEETLIHVVRYLKDISRGGTGLRLCFVTRSSLTQ